MSSYASRHAILSAAITQLGRGGAGALGAAALAAEVGIGKATVLHPYCSTDEVPVVALDPLTEQGFGMVNFAETDPASPIAQVGEESFALIAACFAFASEFLFYAGLRAKLKRSPARARDPFASVFRRLRVDPAQACRPGGIVLACLGGLMLHYALVDDEAEWRGAWRRIGSPPVWEYGHAHRD